MPQTSLDRATYGGRLHLLATVIETPFQNPRFATDYSIVRYMTGIDTAVEWPFMYVNLFCVRSCTPGTAYCFCVRPILIVFRSLL